ncbi:MAG: DNA polymerase III subunit delta' [Patescibacteria group bacterium]|nr:DNA polymerase III subunit delta' [Patescibacteria group bacterium]
MKLTKFFRQSNNFIGFFIYGIKMNIIGHQKNIYFLEQNIAKNQLAHAYLFYGPENIGKATVAEHFITRLFCLCKEEFRECHLCQQINQKIHPDIFWLHGSLKKEKIGVEQIRQIQSFIFSTPFAAPYKIAIIEEADNLTLQASNSLLKALEEPPKKSIIILISRSFNNIIPTLRSRCQALKFNFPGTKEIMAYLKNKHSLSQLELSEILKLSLGRPGRALELAKNTEKITQIKKTTSQILSLLNINESDNKFKLTDLIINSETPQKEALENFLIIIRDILLIKLGLEPINQEFFKQLKILSQNYSFEKIKDLIEEIYQTRLFLTMNVNPRMAIENLLINYL